MWFTLIHPSCGSSEKVFSLCFFLAFCASMRAKDEHKNLCFISLYVVFRGNISSLCFVRAFTSFRQHFVPFSRSRRAIKGQVSVDFQRSVIPFLRVSSWNYNISLWERHSDTSGLQPLEGLFTHPLIISAQISQKNTKDAWIISNTWHFTGLC